MLLLTAIPLALLALVPISLGALSAVLRRPHANLRSLWWLGTFALMAGFVELAFGLVWLPSGVLGLLQIPIAALILSRNDVDDG